MKLAGDNPSTRLLSLDAGSGQINRPIVWNHNYEHVTAVTSDRLHVYTTKGTSTVKKLDRNLISQEDITIAGASTLNGITWDGTYFWLYDQGTNKISKHDPNTFAEISSFTWNGSGVGMTYSASFPTDSPSPALYLNSGGNIYRFPSSC